MWRWLRIGSKALPVLVGLVGLADEILKARADGTIDDVEKDRIMRRVVELAAPLRDLGLG